MKATLSARSSGRASALVIAPAVSPSQRRAAAASSIAEQQERGRLQVAVAAGEEPLDVGELERHSDCTHFERVAVAQARRGCARSAGC